MGTSPMNIGASFRSIVAAFFRISPVSSSRDALTDGAGVETIESSLKVFDIAGSDAGRQEGNGEVVMKANDVEQGAPVFTARYQRALYGSARYTHCSSRMTQ